LKVSFFTMETTIYQNFFQRIFYPVGMGI